ncbi:unnamed protein product [Cyberlindnera jadinii]|uniref:CBS domain-containing protein n=1 Tax=Cyberlindnera jadinii (strain ATCC 18201 / CBS 1600 / BCRC 20928 / JCM 3617 / NBRC 0987 / NRRL Y-1542) TaxID=983966 RepID=A0A0H5C353_CYBJN|nr:unnamed protein product [Cyberlindnera jadinii]
MATIFQLGPDAPVECLPENTGYEASQLMANKRVHCLLVMRSRSLVGIVTAKDMAYRLTAKGLDPKTTLVEQLMTSCPLCLHMDTRITDALTTMVDKNVRHLPLLDSQGAITGVLDITRCFHQAMLRLERIAASAQRLNSVLKEVARDYGDVRSEQADRIVQDVRSLSDVIDIPTLKTVGYKPVCYVDSLSTVYDAAQLMEQQSTTALLVLDGTSNDHKVIGIFTSKDICNRVIARGYNPSKCTVARVLTTSPEFAKDSLTVSAALRLMYHGHFLNLPVISSTTNDIVGIVSVLQLTYAALSQLGKRHELDSVQKTTLDEVTSRLPDQLPWDTFWSAMDKSNDDIQSLESSVSRGPSRNQSPSSSRRTSLNYVSSTSRRPSTNKVKSEDNFLMSPQRVPSTESLSRISFYLKRKTVTFRIIEEKTGIVDKISMASSDNLTLTDDLKPFTLLQKEIEEKFAGKHELFYEDNEGDMVTLTTEADLMTAIAYSERYSQDDNHYVELIIRPYATSEAYFTRIWQAIKRLTSSWTRSGIFTGMALLSIGIILGATARPMLRV